MSLPTSKDTHFGYLVTVRLVKSTFPPNFPKTQVTISTKLNNTLWKTSKFLDSHKIQWKQAYSFEVSDLNQLSMSISISYKSGFFSETTFSHTSINSETFTSPKGLQCTELQNSTQKIQLFWVFIIEDYKKAENSEYLKLINEIEAEREELKFHKNRTLQKLKQVKNKRRACKEELNSLIQNFEPILDMCSDKETPTTPIMRACNSRTYDPNVQVYMN